MLKLILVLLALFQLQACGDLAESGFVIDLEQCTMAGRPVLELLAMEPGVVVSAEQAGDRQLFTTVAADHGVYFGLCGIDVEHGQSMALRIPDLELGRQGFQGVIKPFTSDDTSVADIEARYGPPLSVSGAPAYSQVRRSGNRMGRFADWSSICVGLTMRLNFDHRDRLSAITIYPTPTPDR
ncbi:MAG: hypothetical protein GY814_05720 [Gammaproteobacteria bacterium]|nr:hypothetical protein [Gammaproteobacteria bacterium]